MSSLNSNNNPTFTRIDTPVSINESAGNGDIVSTVSATAAKGGSVKYLVAGGNINNAFNVDETTGVVRVAGDVDYELTHDFHLWIEAQDTTNKLLSAFGKVIVNVNDLNDNTPRFEKTIYPQTINEEVPRGSKVIQVLATDADNGANGRVGYTIAACNTGNAFSINAQSGLITTANRLDRETLGHYDLIIKATDQVSRFLVLYCKFKMEDTDSMI